jgi:hypothetical protein
MDVGSASERIFPGSSGGLNRGPHEKPPVGPADHVELSRPKTGKTLCDAKRYGFGLYYGQRRTPVIPESREDNRPRSVVAGHTADGLPASTSAYASRSASGH